MDLGLGGRVVVVTGGSRGIGRAIADGFTHEGAKVISLDIRTPKPEIEGVEHRLCDVTSRDQVLEAVAGIDREHGRLDVLVNNAGMVADAPAELMDLDEWRHVFEVNVDGVLNTCHAVLPVMKRRRWGRIVNAASFAVIVPSLGAAAYAASKAAVVTLSRTLAGEVGPWGITVNSYAPGMVPTEMNGYGQLPPAAREAKLDQLAIRRWGTAAEVADAVCFLASERAGYITGTLMDISGGKLVTQQAAAFGDYSSPA